MPPRLEGAAARAAQSDAQGARAPHASAHVRACPAPESDAENGIAFAVARADGGGGEAAWTRVPYRRNRCVAFPSALVHVAEPVRFAAGFEHRRVNVGFFFGERPVAGRAQTGEAFIDEYVDAEPAARAPS